MIYLSSAIIVAFNLAEITPAIQLQGKV